MEEASGKFQLMRTNGCERLEAADQPGVCRVEVVC